MIVGLRIDVDTFRGTRLGVPNLCRILARRNIRATFFFSVGPDNMGRHLWRLLKPTFLWKMLRTNAVGLYGWDILFKGTFWPGPLIGNRLGDVIRSASEQGHEIGLHAWDHHAWQSRIDKMDQAQIIDQLTKGVEALKRITGHEPCCSAAPAWKCNDLTLKAKSNFNFRYNSDCRGDGIFLPVVDGQKLSQPQIPASLPTYDELLGRDGITTENYNDRLLALLDEEKTNVLTIHAEVEGLACREMFEDFLDKAKSKKVAFAPLGDLLDHAGELDSAELVSKEIPGREGWVAVRGE